MTYCLRTEDGKVKVEIQCTLANKPTSLLLLAIGVEQNYIRMVKPKKFMSTKEAGAVNRLLETDWEATGVGSRLINWIAVENL